MLSKDEYIELKLKEAFIGAKNERLNLGELRHKEEKEKDKNKPPRLYGSFPYRDDTKPIKGVHYHTCAKAANKTRKQYEGTDLNFN